MEIKLEGRGDRDLATFTLSQCKMIGKDLGEDAAAGTHLNLTNTLSQRT